MSVTTEVYDHETHNREKIDVDKLPDTCPICHTGIAAKPIMGWRPKKRLNGLSVVFQCPMNDCQEYFMACYFPDFFRSQIKGHTLGFCVPSLPQETETSDVIMELSPRFVKVFSQAQYAEQRSALEELASISHR